MLLFMIIILVHELGHFVTAFLLGWKIQKIILYPYGGCSYFDEDINVSLKEEFLVLVMGPAIQILFILFLQYVVSPPTYVLLKRYSYYLLMFNLLPIYPLDGGKILGLVLALFVSYYRSLQITIYFSFVFFLCLLFFSTLFFYSFTWILILVLLLFSLWKEMNKVSFYYQKFLLERYFHCYSFPRYKMVSHHYQMMRDTYHLVGELDEKKYLERLFRG